MKKTCYLLALALLLLVQPTFAQDKNTAKMLEGKWRCTQNLVPEEGIELKIEYIQQLTAQRKITLNGGMEMKFTQAEMNAMFGGDSLKYLFEGEGSWSTQPNRLTVKTDKAIMTPNSPIAKQLHDSGIMDVNTLRDMQSEDEFIIKNLSKNSVELTHTKENFTTQCVRTN